MAKEKHYRAKVTGSGVTVEIEGPEKGFTEITRAVSQVLAQSPHLQPPAPTQAQEVLSRGAQQPVDIRTFFAQKNPRTNQEAVAVAAFYLTNIAPPEQRRETVNWEAIDQAFRQAKRPIPTAQKQTLVNTKNAGYLDPTGIKGDYRLNPVGYNLVEHTLGVPKEGAYAEESPRPRKSGRAKDVRRTTTRRRSS